MTPLGKLGSPFDLNLNLNLNLGSPLKLEIWNLTRDTTPKQSPNPDIDRFWTSQPNPALNRPKPDSNLILKTKDYHPAIEKKTLFQFISSIDITYTKDWMEKTFYKIWQIWVPWIYFVTHHATQFLAIEFKNKASSES